MTKDIEPGETVDGRDPNEFSDYKRGMATDADWPMAVEWDDANAAKLEASTDETTLAAFVRDAASARALLASVGGAYLTEPLVAVQIAAVSQFVMRKGGASQAIWCAALLEKAETSADTYTKLFCLDQLRWCGAAEDAVRIRAIGAASADRAVRDMAELVAGEIA